MEYLDLYDENKRLTGEKIPRTNKKDYIKEGTYINLVIIYIKNDENKFLIQKTSKRKGGNWATTGGHVKSGQTCHEAIIEEVKEELGIDISHENVKLIETEKGELAFQDVYYLTKNINIEDIIVQEEEVSYVKWLSVEEIKELINRDEFRPGNINSFLKLVEYLKIK